MATLFLNAVTFNTAPTLSGANISSASIPVASVVGTAATLSGTNNFTGNSTFNTNLPTSSVTPTVTNQLITKLYGDTTYGILASAQTWAGVNTFTPQAVFTNSIKIPLGASAGFVLTSDASGNLTLQSPGSGLTATVVTSSTSPTALLTVAVPLNGVVTISGTINAATTTSYLDATGGSFNATVVSVAGVLTMVGSPIVWVNAESTGTFNVVISGTNIVVQVTAPSIVGYSWFTTYGVQTN